MTLGQWMSGRCSAASLSWKPKTVTYSSFCTSARSRLRPCADLGQATVVHSPLAGEAQRLTDQDPAVSSGCAAAGPESSPDSVRPLGARLGHRAYESVTAF